jgi:hypothetical protein
MTGRFSMMLRPPNDRTATLRIAYGSRNAGRCGPSDRAGGVLCGERAWPAGGGVCGADYGVDVRGVDYPRLLHQAQI